MDESVKIFEFRIKMPGFTVEDAWDALRVMFAESRAEYDLVTWIDGEGHPRYQKIVGKVEAANEPN